MRVLPLKTKPRIDQEVTKVGRRRLFGRSWVDFCRSKRPFRPMSGRLGRSKRSVGATWSDLGSILARSWVDLGTSSQLLRSSWVDLGALESPKGDRKSLGKAPGKLFEAIFGQKVPTSSIPRAGRGIIRVRTSNGRPRIDQKSVEVASSGALGSTWSVEEACRGNLGRPEWLRVGGSGL